MGVQRGRAQLARRQRRPWVARRQADGHKRPTGRQLQAAGLSDRETARRARQGIDHVGRQTGSRPVGPRLAQRHADAQPRKQQLARRLGQRKTVPGPGGRIALQALQHVVPVLQQMHDKLAKQQRLFLCEFRPCGRPVDRDKKHQSAVRQFGRDGHAVVQAVALAEGDQLGVRGPVADHIALADHHPEPLHGRARKLVLGRQFVPLLCKTLAQADAAVQPVARRHMHVAGRHLAPPGGFKRDQRTQNVEGLVQHVLRLRLLGQVRQTQQAAAEGAQWILGWRWRGRRPTRHGGARQAHRHACCAGCWATCS